MTGFVMTFVIFYMSLVKSQMLVTNCHAMIASILCHASTAAKMIYLFKKVLCGRLPTGEREVFRAMSFRSGLHAH